MRCSSSPLEGKTFRGRKLDWAAAGHSPPRFSVERPRTCAVSWLLSHPEIPSGFTLADFRDLERHAQTISGLVLSGSSNPRLVWLSPWLTQFASATITVDGQGYTVWEARSEIVGRAIEYLERR